MNRKPRLNRSALQRQELKLERESSKCSSAFNSVISSLTIIAKGADKNTGNQVAHIFDFSTVDEIPAEFYEFLNSYGASSIAKRDIIRHRLRMMTAEL